MLPKAHIKGLKNYNYRSCDTIVGSVWKDRDTIVAIFSQLKLFCWVAEKIVGEGTTMNATCHIFLDEIWHIKSEIFTDRQIHIMMPSANSHLLKNTQLTQQQDI